MPRISAPTVREHRAVRRRALLDAARDLLAESGERAPSLAAVAERAGLSRTGIYQYFRSREELLDAVIEDVVPRWTARANTAVAAAGSPGERVLAYADVNLRLVAEGEHALVSALAESVGADRLAARTASLHADLRAPLLDALRDLGEDDVDTVAELVNGVVYTGSRMIEEGADPEVVRTRVHALLAPYLVGRPR